MDIIDEDFGAINEKHQQILVWLEQMYGGESVPQFELNQKTISILYKLMQENQLQDKNCQLVIDDLRQKAAEYGVEAQRLSRVVKDVNLSQGCLSQSGVTSLRTLANLALLLDVRDASDTSYLLALQNLSSDLMKTAETRKQEETCLAEFTQKSKAALHKYNSLLKTLHHLEEKSVTQRPETEKRRKKVSFFIDKAKQYKGSMQKLQAELTRVGADPSLYHQTLVKKSEELQALKQKIAPLRIKLQMYYDLPPDLSQTKVKIEELKQQVSALESELTRRIDLMHL
ncbi:HAUS augmin-like complex subunit 1 isoform X1 [Haliotis cracherodii]|uniref:HAUS augmin-like complex subunit 1 isoform X1 n=1 Tax=Haliotis cracherodii TaxID=6455 RepID=UPI0039EC48F3